MLWGWLGYKTVLSFSLLGDLVAQGVDGEKWRSAAQHCCSYNQETSTFSVVMVGNILFKMSVRSGGPDGRIESWRLEVPR